MISIPFWFVISLLIPSLYSYTSEDVIGTSCMLAAAKYNFGCMKSSVPDYKCLCNNLPYMGSVSFCTIEYSPEKNEEKYGVHTISKTCQMATNSKMTKLEFHIQWLNASHYIRLRNGRPDFNEYLHTPIELPQDIVNKYISSGNSFNSFRKATFSVSSGLLIYVSILLFFRTIYFRSILIWPQLLRTFDTKYSKRLKRRLILADIQSRRRRYMSIFNFHFTLQSLLLWSYQLVHILLLFANRQMYINGQFRSYLALQSAMMALSQLPMLFLLSTRNNFLIYLTGLSRESFLIGHRWISWGIIFDLLIHAICSVSPDFKNFYQIAPKTSYINWAVVSISFAGFIVLLSLLPVKQGTVFAIRYLHIILVVIFIVGSWKHIQYSSARHYISTSIAIWVYDTVFRCFFTLFNGFFCRGYIKVHPREVIELEFNFRRRLRCKAGYYGFIHVRKWHLFWQSTPVALLERNTEDGRTTLQAFSSATSLMTKSHWNYLKRHPHLSEKIRLTFEGPYGTPRTLHLYDSIALIASGRGILSIYSYALTVKNSIDKYSKVILVWTVCDQKEIKWFHENLSYINEDKRFEVYIFISDWCEASFGRYENTEIHPISETAIKDNDVKSDLNLQISASHPDMKWIVCQTIMRSTGSLAFMTCCSDMMNDEVRLAVAQNIEQAKIRIDCFCEPFPSF